MLTEVQRFKCRIWNRNKRHGNWRQTFIDFGGLCALCFSPHELEFHEPFGENNDKLEILKFQARVLLCSECHTGEHDRLRAWRRTRVPRVSMVAEDVQTEINLCGGWDNWIAKFNLVDRFGCLINTRR